MNRYYNAEHIKKLIESHEWRMTLAKERGGNGFVEYDKLVLDSKEFQKRLSSLPTIEVGDVNDDLIKRQDVIKIIDKYYKQFVFISDADEVIAEIESLQTVIPSEDCISRKALLEQIKGKYGDEWHFVDIIKDALSVVPQVPSEDCIDRYSALSELDPSSYEYEVIKELPSVVSSAEPKRGKWENNGNVLLNCSLCDWETAFHYDYCPNCGAKMEER